MLTTKAPIHTQLEPYFLSRKNLYRFLHLLFSDHLYREAFIEIKNNEEILNLLLEIQEGGEILHNFFVNCSKEQVVKEREEYLRLFVGPGPLGAPPWESFYRSKERLLFDECTYKVREQYHQFNLKYVRENNDPDDHLLIELEFLLYLTDQSLQVEEVSELKNMIESQIYFLEHHLSKWIPYFSKRIIENTNSQLYLGASMLLDEYIQFDLQSLIEVKEALANV